MTRYLFSVSALATRYRHGQQETRFEICCVTAADFDEATRLGREKILDRDDLHPDHGWEIVSIKACAPAKAEILEVADLIHREQAGLKRRLTTPRMDEGEQKRALSHGERIDRILSEPRDLP